MIIEPEIAAESSASDAEREHLSLFAGEMVYRFSRTRGKIDRLFVENVSLPAALFPGLRSPVVGITALAAEYDLHLGEALEKISTTPACATVANALGLRTGTVVLKLDRVVHLRDGRPVEWRIAYTPDQGTLEELKQMLRGLVDGRPRR